MKRLFLLLLCFQNHMHCMEDERSLMVPISPFQIQITEKTKSTRPISFLSTTTPQNQAVTIPETHRRSPTPTNTKTSQEQLQRAQHIKHIRSSAMLLSVLGFAGYSYYNFQYKQNHQKRFIGEAVSGASIAFGLLKGATGCVAGAYAYYKVRHWLYDGFVKTKELETRLTDLETKWSKKFDIHGKALDQQAFAINDHAKSIDLLRSIDFEKIDKQIAELERVARAHAQDIDSTRTDLADTIQQVGFHAHAINSSATTIEKIRTELRTSAGLLDKLLSQYSNISETAQRTQEQTTSQQQAHNELQRLTKELHQRFEQISARPRTPTAFVTEPKSPRVQQPAKPAAVPQATSTANSNQLPHAAKVSIPQKTDDNCGCC